MFFLGGGKCPNLGVVNVRIWGVVNVLLANDSQSKILSKLPDRSQIQFYNIFIEKKTRVSDFRNWPLVAVGDQMAGVESNY